MSVAAAVGVIVAGSAAVGAAVAGAVAVGAGVAGAAVAVSAGMGDGGDAVAIVGGVDAVGGASQAVRVKASSRSSSHLAGPAGRLADIVGLTISAIVAGCGGS